LYSSASSLSTAVITRFNALWCSIFAVLFIRILSRILIRLIRCDLLRDFLSHKLSHTIPIAPRNAAELIIEGLQDVRQTIKKQSAQRDLIAAALLKYGTISVTEAWSGGYGANIRRLGARIWELRDEGWVIKTDERPDGECYYHLVSMPSKQNETPPMRADPESAAQQTVMNL
jgi:hypothetical protein